MAACFKELFKAKVLAFDDDKLSWTEIASDEAISFTRTEDKAQLYRICFLKDKIFTLRNVEEKFP